jgi:hypothetical protein
MRSTHAPSGLGAPTADDNTRKGRLKNRTGAGRRQSHAKPNGAAPHGMLAFALSYVGRGWWVFPADKSGEKKSHKAARYSNGERWGASNDPAQIRGDFRQFPKANIGLPTGSRSGFFVVEADTPEGHEVDGIAALARLEKQHGKLPPTLMSESPSGSVHRYFAYPAGVVIPNSTSQVAPGVDVRGEGGMVLAPPSLRPGKGRYRWLNDCPIAAAPDWLIKLCRDKDNESEHEPNPEKVADIDLVRKALAVIPNKADVGWKEWKLTIGMAVWAATNGSEEGYNAFNDWSAKWPDYNEDHTRKAWDEINSCPPSRIGFGTLAHHADMADPGWRGKGDDDAAAASVEAAIADTQAYDFPSEETLPLYDWLLGRHVLRGEVSGTAAAGGTGKSTLGILEALMMSSTAQLTHDKVPSRPLRVVLVNLEDKRSTMDKRIAAAMRHHGVKKEDIGNRLVVLAKGDIKIRIAKQGRGGAGSVVRNEKVVAALVDLMLKHKADVLSVDSFIRTHSVAENDNPGIEQVVECFEDIAERADCAVHLWHHTRKQDSRGDGQSPSVESARGAKAFIDACRSVRVLDVMTKKQAKDLDNTITNPREYFRAYNGKRNFAPSVEDSDWYHIEGVRLNNGPADCPTAGDNIGVVEKWEPPDININTKELTTTAIAEIVKKVAGATWRKDSRADMWIGEVIGDVLNLDPDTQKEEIKNWLKLLLSRKILKVVAGKDHRRHDVMQVVPGEAATEQPEAQPEQPFRAAKKRKKRSKNAKR